MNFNEIDFNDSRLDKYIKRMYIKGKEYQKLNNDKILEKTKEIINGF